MNCVLLDKKIIVVSAFNTFSFSDIRFTKEWIDLRMNILMNYTLKSLKAQTNQDFTAFFLYDPRTEEKVLQAASKYEEPPENIKFVNYKFYNLLMKKEIKDFDTVYIVRIDCDDMYHVSYIQQLHEYTPKEETKVIINQKGYLYDSVNHRIANYYYESPPFYTFIYKTKEYLTGLRHKTPGGHAGAIQLPHEIIDRKNFIFHVHSANTLNKFNQRFNTGDVITDKKEITHILEEYIG